MLYPPQPSCDLALAFLTLERLIMFPHVRVVFSLFSKIQIANVAFPGNDFVNKIIISIALSYL